MPGGDRTGPMGAGPMTGRGVGLCAGYDVPGNMNPSSGRFGRGFGHGRGGGFGRGFQHGGRGWRHQYYATGVPGWARGYDYPNPAVPPVFGTPASTKTVQAEELAYLKEQTRYFKGALEDIEKRVNELQRETENANEVQQNKKK